MAELHPRLMGSLVARRGVDRETARDACQHAYLAFVERRPSVESLEHAFRWLNITAHRQVNKWQRRQRRFSDREVPELALPDVVAEAVERQLLLDAVARAFGELPPVDREVLRLAVERRARGHTRRERDRVSLQVLRARQRLRDRLEDWWAVLPWVRWRRGSLELSTALSPGLAVKMLSVFVLGGATFGAAEPGTPRLPAASRTVAVVPVADTAGGSRSQAPPAARARIAGTDRQSAALPPAVDGQGPPLGPLDNHRMTLESPATPHGPVEVGTSPRQPKDRSLLCWGNWIVVPDGCIQHPLRP